MRRWMATVSIVILTALSAAVAQDAPPAGRPQRPGRGGEAPGQAPGRGGAVGQAPGRGGRPQQIGIPVAEALLQLELTEPQQKQIDPILAEYNEALAAANAKLREQTQAIREAGGEDARARMTEANEAAAAERKALTDRLKSRLSSILTREQTVKFDRLIGPAGPFDQFVAQVTKLDLTAEQRPQINTLVRQADADARARAEDQEKADVYAAAQRAITELLTEEQRAALRRAQAQQAQDAMQARIAQELGLTAEQQTKLTEANAAMREAMQGAQGREDFQRIREEYNAKLAEFLTPEQIQQMNALRGGMGAPGMGAPGTGAPGQGAPGQGRPGRGGAAPGGEAPQRPQRPGGRGGRGGDAGPDA